MKIRNFLRMHHNLIISVIDVIQIINIFIKSNIIAILIIIFRNLMREKNDVQKK